MQTLHKMMTRDNITVIVLKTCKFTSFYADMTKKATLTLHKMMQSAADISYL